MRGDLQQWTTGAGPKLAEPGALVTDWADRRAQAQAGETAFIHLLDGDEVQQVVSYGELAHRARRIAASLLERDLVGRRVAIVLPAGIDYIATLLGCFYAGAVAVPILPARRGAAFERLTTILRNCDASLAVLPSAVAGQYGGTLPATTTLAVAPEELEGDPATSLPSVDPSSTALLQYTSGSTAAPRGAMVSHDNLVANVRTMVFEGIGPCVSWLPPHHDMGLIGALLQTFARGQSTVMLSPLHFIQRPIRWIRAMARFGGIGCPAPDFAYRLCVDRIDERDLDGLDLSTWKFALSGAEPVRPSTIDAFCARFEPYGFRRESFHPCYGLAEATLMVSCSPASRGPRTIEVDADALEQGRVRSPSGGRARSLVSCGTVVPDTTVAIVPRTDGEDVGEIWVRGPGVVSGYFRDSESTVATFDATHPVLGSGFLRTGDAGFILDGELFITGRVKETIVIRGRNLMPEDIEHAARGAHPSLAQARVAAFSDSDGGMVVGVERGVGDTEDPGIVLRAISDRVAADTGARPRRVIMVPRRSIPLTTSGKLRRGECGRLLAQGSLEVVATYDPTERP